MKRLELVQVQEERRKLLEEIPVWVIALVHAEAHAEARCVPLSPGIWLLLVALMAAVLMMSISVPVVEEPAALDMGQEREHRGTRPAFC